MTMQFLPWVRRGLAAELTHTDDGGAVPANAALPVTITVSGRAASKDVQTYGPGDVTGLDTQSITRTVPGRHAINVAPDEFAAVEFDAPDLPWMFTPARASGTQRLRPWLVVVVVRRMSGVRVGVDGRGPLPVLTIEDPAIPEEELPDLSQSWAWAHAQVITETSGDNARAALSGPAHTRLSRIVCPRRLEAHADYIAALVPAFDLGVAAGLGFPSDSATAGPAWDIAAMPVEIRLPVFYHWEFTTGPAGDFESLARKLRPAPIPDSVGRSPMYIGAAHPALPDPPDGTAIVNMEGALRAPEPGPGEALAPALSRWVDALTGIVDASAGNIIGGTAANAEPVGPPVYGQWHVDQHSVPARRRRPLWLRDLNADPRHRTAAGLGAEVVRAYQEEYVDAAWQQAGAVLAANQLLGIARAMAVVTDRIHARHIETIDPIRVLQFIGPARDHILIGNLPLRQMMRDTIMLPGASDRMFRRMSSPRSPHLRGAAIRAGIPMTPGDSADVGSLGRLGDGSLVIDLARTPDGLRTSRAPDVVNEIGQGVPAEVGPLVQGLRAAERALPPDRIGGLTLRDDLTSAGLVDAEALAGLRASVLAGGSLWSKANDLRKLVGSGVPGGQQLFGVVANVGQLAVVGATADGTLVSIVNGRDIVLDRPGGAGQPNIPARLGSAFPGSASSPGRLPGGGLGGRPVVPRSGTGLGRDLLRGGGLRGGPMPLTFDTMRRALAQGAIDLGPVIDALGLGGGRDGAVLIKPPTKDAGALDGFAGDFAKAGAQSETAFEVFAPSLRPPVLEIATVQSQVVRATHPRPVIEARIRLRIEAGGTSFADALAAGRLGVTEIFQETPVSPVLVGPVLDRALYQDLARFDQSRFLPGAGAIPENAISLLETNPRFVEAFMVGANHEFNRELLWRRYPTDRRTTAFRKFWDRVDGGDDIEPVHLWPGASRLGSMGRGDVDGSVVLIVRGELLRRYPNTIVYAVGATAEKRIDPAAAPIGPVFSGRLAPDFTFVGFDFDIDAAKAGNGMMFVLQEQPTEPRFGLDATGLGMAGTPPAAWSDLSWAHVGVTPGGFLDMVVFGRTVRRPLTGDPGAPDATFNSQSAEFAAITFLRPFRAAVHVTEIEG